MPRLIERPTQIEAAGDVTVRVRAKAPERWKAINLRAISIEPE